MSYARFSYFRPCLNDGFKQSTSEENAVDFDFVCSCVMPRIHEARS